MRLQVIIAIAAFTAQIGVADASEREVVSVAEFAGSVKVTVAKCPALTEHAGALLTYFAQHGVSASDRQGSIFQGALHDYIDRKQKSHWECVRAFIDHGPQGEEDRFFDLDEGQVGQDFLQEVIQRERRAATNFRLATNARNSCGLFLDDRALIYRLLEDGIYSPFMHEMRGGKPPTASEQQNPHFLEQLQAWRLAGASIQGYGDLRAYCHAMWNQFGPDGTDYPGILQKPDFPYSPYELK